MTPLEERSGYGAEARPANVGDDREAFYAGVHDLDSLIKAEACFRKGALCGVDIYPSASLYRGREAPRRLARLVTQALPRLPAVACAARGRRPSGTRLVTMLNSGTRRTPNGLRCQRTGAS